MRPTALTMASADHRRRLSATRWTGPSEQTTAVIRVSRSTGRRMPATRRRPSTPVAREACASQLRASDCPPAEWNPCGE